MGQPPVSIRRSADGRGQLRIERIRRHRSKASQKPLHTAASLFQHRIEHRPEVAGRGIDDTEHLAGRSLLSKRLITFGFEFVALCRQLSQLALKITDGRLEMGQCAIWRWAHLRPR
jgi:hypothetical protein